MPRVKVQVLNVRLSATRDDGDFDPAALRSNTFSMEWPPRSGRQQQFPEVDRAEWLSIEAAQRRISKGQAPFLQQLRDKLGERGRGNV